MKNRRSLLVAEYISLIGSVAGSAAAVVSGQVIYATAPLSLSILLNLVNRYRYEQQARQSTNIAITEAHQQLSADIQSLRSSVLTLPAQVDLSSVQQALFKLTEEIAAERAKIQSHPASLSALDLKPINEGISQLTNQSLSLSESLAVVRQQLDALPQSERFDALESATAQLSSEIALLKTKIENRLSPLKAFNIESIQSDISQLREQCATLQEFLDSLVYRMLSDGVLGSHISSDKAESRIDKIVQQYVEQTEQRSQDYDTEALFDLTQEDEQEDDSWLDDEEDDGRRG